MHVIVTQQLNSHVTLECVHNNNNYCCFCGITMWSGQRPGPEPAGSGRAWASNMTIVLRAGPGHTFWGRAVPVSHNSLCGPGPGRVCTTASGPGRAWASNHICGSGVGLNFRPVQCPKWHVPSARDCSDVCCRNNRTLSSAVCPSPRTRLQPFMLTIIIDSLTENIATKAHWQMVVADEIMLCAREKYMHWWGNWGRRG